MQQILRKPLQKKEKKHHWSWLRIANKNDTLEERQINVTCSEKNLNNIELKAHLIMLGENKPVQYDLNVVCVE